jgi:Ca-activated chloride channel homolog
MLEHLTFNEPKYFYLLFIIPLMVAWYIFRNRNKRSPAIKISMGIFYRKAPITIRQRLRHLPFVARVLCVVSLIFILARPQQPKSWREIETEGIDIVLAMDISTSMLAKDFEVNRLEASKDVAKEFVHQRKNDRIGLVLFSARSFTQFPLTTDHEVLINLLQKVKTGMITDGTAIGLGLANAVRNLKNSFSNNKVIILLTDGVNNAGAVNPLDAGKMAKDLNIRVYTIDIRENAEMMNAASGSTDDIDLGGQTLKDIAAMTGGKYFSSSDKQSLREVYDEIDKMEKARISTKDIGTKDAFLPFALLAGLSLLAEILLGNVIFKTIPG